MKKVVSLLDLKEMKTRNDCEIACYCVKRANVALHVGLCEEIFARKHTATHKPTSAQPLSAPHSDQRDIHQVIACGAPWPTAQGAIIRIILIAKHQSLSRTIPI